MISREAAKSILKKEWQNEDLKFVAEFKKVKPKYSGGKDGCFYLKADDKPLSYPRLDGENFLRNVSIYYYLLDELIEGQAYLLDVDLSDDRQREKSNNPFLLKITGISKIEQSLEVIPAKEFIAIWFGRKGESPGDAASIAGQLRLNQLELYTQTKRFIFELIQNADDMPMEGRPVKIEIRLLDNFFIFSHNGKYFSREDVMAISDAAQSTKRSDETKTGYKGIGFKSVFSDSEKVFIRSQDYSFKFDKSADIYSDFKELYRYKWSRLSNAEQDIWFAEYRGREKQLTNIDNIPWQIKPIWVEPTDFPDEIRPYFTKKNNVNIALGVGASKIREKQYDTMIQSLVNDPRFLLFLRHSRRIEYYTPAGTIKVIEVLKTDDLTKVRADGKLQSVYKTFNAEISINNKAFSKAGFQFEHIQLEEGRYAFKDANGNILNNIPEKLGRLKTTVLSFAVKDIEGKIEKISASESILYNYLPTSDQRYRFPFIINADFISKTDREGILSENIWNHYLFFNIGYELTRWLENLSSTNRFYDSYLNVLPDELLDESHPDLSAINAAFNKGLLIGIGENSFIPDSLGKNKQTTSLLIDDSGLSAVIGEQSYLDFIGSQKALVNEALDKRKLKTKYLEVEIFGYKELRDILKDPVKLVKLNQCLAAISAEKMAKFLGWLDKACEKNLTFTDISPISFIALNQDRTAFLSILELATKNDCFIRDTVTEKIQQQLAKAGAKLTGFVIDNYPFLKAVFVKDGNTYLATNKSIFSRLTLLFGSKLALLDVNDRLIVLGTLRTIEGIDIGTVAKLPWFRNNLGEFKLLGELVNNEDFVFTSFYNSYFLHQLDKKLLGKEYIDLLRPFGELLKIDSFTIAVSGIETYSTQSELIVLLNKLLQKGETDANIFGFLAQKILLKGNNIAGDLYQDTVSAFITGEDKITTTVSFQLKDLLPDISEGSKNVSKLLQVLSSLNDSSKEALRTKVFALKAMEPAKIETRILAQVDALNYDQFLYLAISHWFNKNTGSKKIKLNAESPLTLAYKHNKIIEIHQLLDIMFLKKVSNKDFQVEHEGLMYALIPKVAIICNGSNLLIGNEHLPHYLNTWIGNSQEKKKFLIEKGALDETYNHILFRKAILERDNEFLEDISGELEKDIQHFINTAIFMENQQKEADLEYDWCEEEVVAFYNQFSTMKNIDFDKRAFPVYKHGEQRNFTLEKLDKRQSYYTIHHSWGQYAKEVAEYIFAGGNCLLPKELKLPAGYTMVNAGIAKSVDKNELIKGSERYNADYYEDWDQYEQHTINIYSGSFIPYQIVFEGEVIAEAIPTHELVWEEGKQYFVCDQIRNEIPFCLKTMGATDAMSLARAKFFPKPAKPSSRTNNDLTEEEIRELEMLFNRRLSSSELSNHWLLACFKALKHYKTVGYSVSYAEANFENCIKKRMLEKVTSGGKTLRVLPRSGKQNLLRITLAAWNALEDVSTELFVLSSNGHQIFTNQDELMDSSDNLLFTIATEYKKDKTRIVSNLFGQDSISHSQYDDSIQVILLIQLNGGSSFGSLFAIFNNTSKITDF